MNRELVFREKHGSSQLFWEFIHRNRGVVKAPWPASHRGRLQNPPHILYELTSIDPNDLKNKVYGELVIAVHFKPKTLQLSAVDVLVPTTMKNAAKCDT